MYRRLRIGLMAFLLGMRLMATHAQAAKQEPTGLKVSGNGHYLLEAGKPFFLLADTAWNLDALTDDQIKQYLTDRSGHGFSAVMFCLDFAPQARSENAYGQAAYVGKDKSDLNPDFFMHVNQTVKTAERGECMRWMSSSWLSRRRPARERPAVRSTFLASNRLAAHIVAKTNMPAR